MSRERILLLAVRRALKLLLAALDTYLDGAPADAAGADADRHPAGRGRRPLS